LRLSNINALTKFFLRVGQFGYFFSKHNHYIVTAFKQIYLSPLCKSYLARMQNCLLTISWWPLPWSNVGGVQIAAAPLYVSLSLQLFPDILGCFEVVKSTTGWSKLTRSIFQKQFCSTCSTVKWEIFLSTKYCLLVYLNVKIWYGLLWKSQIVQV
jgi:hypothetical protein